MKSIALTAISLFMAPSARAHRAMCELPDGRAERWLEQVTNLRYSSAS